MHSTPAVRARAITHVYGDVVALDEVDLDVGAGRVHGLVGPNGAGKTTLLGLVLGLTTVTAGTLEVLGTRVGRSVPEGVAGFVDGPGLYPSLTARQNLQALASLRGGPRADVEGALEQVGLVGVADQRVRGFSLGMRQRLGLAAALLVRPRVLVLDEPANGLDPEGTRHVHQVINDLAADGVAVLFSSHRMDDLAALCTDVTILSAGRVAYSGAVDDLRAASGELEYRLSVSDPSRGAVIASGVPGLRLGAAGRAAELVVRGPVHALDQLVSGLVGAGVAVRELCPVVPPLEAAFLALTVADPAEVA
jgi:ABC-2 type transport system ATP-binding protein